MKPEEFLTKTQIDKIKRVTADPILMDALYKVFLSPLYTHGVMKRGEEHKATLNFALTPAFNMLLQKREMWDLEKLGASTLSNAMAIQLVEQGFGELEKFKDEAKAEKEDSSQDPR